MKPEKRKTSHFAYIIFKIVRGLVRLFYGKVTLVGAENMPDQDAIFVGNHTQMNGPIVGELFFPDTCYTWCAGEMMHCKDVPRYAYADFWSQKPAWCRPFYKAVSYLIAPLCYCIFNNARTIGVYRDMRIVSTFRETVTYLSDRKTILIFPEKAEPDNNIVYQFQENFVDVARLYYKKTGKELTFVPLYIAPALHKVFIGKGIAFDAQNEITAERARICAALSASITETARSLPKHKVVPYLNLPKKRYLTNKDIGEVPQ
ncbi:MAG: hypothetical protein E7402_00160 [Ruminococcaceae bacterium]|nr:hypothetical protein [Oscillospiraceae bacterium]